MALSFEQYQQLREKGLNNEQISGFEFGDQPRKKTEGVTGAIGRGFSNIKESIVESGEGVADVLESDVSDPLKTVGVTGKLLKPFTQILAEVPLTAARVGGEAIESATGVDVNTAAAEKFENLVEAGLDTEIAQKAQAFYEQHIATSPEAEVAAGALFDILDFATVGTGVGAGKKATAKAAEGTIKQSLVALDAIGGKVSKISDFGAPQIAKGKELAKGAGEFGVAQTFGLKPETVKEIVKKPAKFTKEAIEEVDRESIFDKAKSAIDKRSAELRSTGKEFEGIKAIDKQINVSEDTIKKVLKDKGIELKDGKVTSTLGSDIQLSKVDAKALEDVMELLKGKQTLTPKEVLNLRTRLSAMSGFGEGKTGASKLIAKEIRKSVDDVAKKEIPGLRELDAKFSSEKGLIDKVRTKIFNKDGSVKDNAVSQIANLTGKGKEFALERMEKLIPGITEDLNILKAIEDINFSGGQKVGTYTRALLGTGGGFAAGGPIGAVLGAIATSPKVGVELLRAYGNLKKPLKAKIESIIGKIKGGKKLVGDEIKIMNEAVDNKARKAGEDIKNIRPGMNIKDITEEVREGFVQSGKNVNEVLDEIGFVQSVEDLGIKIDEFAKNTGDTNMQSFFDNFENVEKLFELAETRGLEKVNKSKSISGNL